MEHAGVPGLNPSPRYANRPRKSRVWSVFEDAAGDICRSHWRLAASCAAYARGTCLGGVGVGHLFLRTRVHRPYPNIRVPEQIGQSSGARLIAAIQKHQRRPAIAWHGGGLIRVKRSGRTSGAAVNVSGFGPHVVTVRFIRRSRCGADTRWRYKVAQTRIATSGRLHTAPPSLPASFWCLCACLSVSSTPRFAK